MKSEHRAQSSLKHHQRLSADSSPERLTDYSEDGVDLTLIRSMLSKTPAQRLAFLDAQIADIEAIRKLNDK